MADVITQDPDQLLYDTQGLGEVAGHIAKSLGVNALSGIKGLSTLPQGAEAATQAIKDYQAKYGPGMDLSPSGQNFVRNVLAPAYTGVAQSPVGKAVGELGNAYGQGTQEWSDLAGKYLGPEAAGVVGAAGDVLPYLIQPEGVLGKEAAAGAKAYTKSKVAASEVDPALHGANFSPPGNAESYLATDPETGQHIGHVTFVKRGDGVSNLRMDVHPNYRGQGIGPDLISSAVDDAHSQGLPYRSDTQVSVPAMRSYLKTPGAQVNTDTTEFLDPHDGLVAKSNNGRPLVEFPVMPKADDATLDEHPQFDPNSYTVEEGHAEGGPILGDIAALVKEIGEKGGATRNLINGTVPKEGFAVSIHKGLEKQLPAAPTADDLQNFVEANKKILAQEGNHLGAWQDPPKTGPYYLDVSHIDPDFGSAVNKAKANNQLGIFDLSTGETIPTTPDYTHFVHYSNLSTPTTTLDPAFYGTGLKGAEAKRGGTKMVSLYPSDIAKPEAGLENKTKYRVTVPTKDLYDMSNDPMGLRSSAPSYSDAEDAVKDAGFAGYTTPTHSNPLFQGQGRMFGQTPATRLGPGPIDDEDLSQGFAEGGEVAPVLDDLGALVAKYANAAPNEHAGQLAQTVADTGAVTYNPTSGEMHAHGYAVPTEPSRSVALDSAPSSDELHDFMLQNQEAFDADPKAALHVESDEHGNHFIHVAHIEPDFEGAMAAAKAFDTPGVREIHTGTNFSTNQDSASGSLGTTQQTTPEVESYLESSKVPAANLPADIDAEKNQRPTARWVHGQPTVDPAALQRTAFPGIYNDPRQVIEEANKMVGPEDPMLQRLFGVSRQDLSDIATSRQGNELGSLPGAKPNPAGAASARAVMTPANEQRLIDVLSEARGTPLHTGMTGWYAMDPLYERFRQIFGEEEAPARYAQFNTLMGMASPGSDVGTEIARGTSANWLHAQGRFPDFQQFAGIANDVRPNIPNFPQDMMGVPGHVYHPTAQAGPMADYLRTGSMQMQSPKVPAYVNASGVPQIGFQTDLPVGDAHWARGVGLADTRNWRYNKGEQVVPGSSVSTPEMQMLAPWWRDRVAAQAGYQSVPAQATAWGAFAPYTGVESAIGAPKLEILATQIQKAAQRLGVSPETARDLVIRGQAGAY